MGASSVKCTSLVWQVTDLSPRPRMNIQNLVEEFYALEAIFALLVINRNNSFNPMRHSHERWRDDFIDFRNLYANKMASAIFDYTAIVVAGELRHCWERASKALAGYPDSDFGRDDVYERCTEWTPESILNAGVALFDERQIEWASDYGGSKWMLIAKAGLCRGILGDVAFVDHCVDLSHNNSVYFDKGAGIFSMINGSTRYMNFLDKKRMCELEILLAPQGKAFNTLLQRAINIGILNPPDSFLEWGGRDRLGMDLDEEKILGYTPRRWGNKNLALNLVETFAFNN